MKRRSPHVLAPVDGRGEVAVLLAAGASWLYGGALPREWARRYPSIIPLNQRTFASAQFPGLAEMEEAIHETRERGGHFALVLNAPFYLGEQIPLALTLARSAAGAGAEAVIAGDPGLLRALGREGLPLALHLSVMGLAHNPAAVSCFHRLGVTRVILPRHLDLAQAAALAESSPEVEFEAFLFVGNCPNVEGVCSFLHDSPAQRWPCEWPFTAAFADGASLPASVAGGCFPIRGEERRDACGLCALPALRKAGVSGFKVVGRGAPTARKAALVEAAARALAVLEAGEGTGGGEGGEGGREKAGWGERCRATYRFLFGHACSRRSCYYPALWERG